MMCSSFRGPSDLSHIALITRDKLYFCYQICLVYIVGHLSLSEYMQETKERLRLAEPAG